MIHTLNQTNHIRLNHCNYSDKFRYTDKDKFQTETENAERFLKNPSHSVGH